ncbi:restriction endonuclease [Cytobacillus firmus]|uniref:restriction endonuclease n=1 Tax=Cytobacillus firmus TaxID=1399 RepID=UPI0020C61A86|nr:restriction endonuclease [Cytobacillus firmus]
MKKRKSKKQSKKESELIFSSILVLGLIMYYFTGDLITIGITIFVGVSIWFLLTFLKEKKKEMDLKQSGIYDIDKMDGIQFEHYLSSLFKSQGYNVKVTKATGDYGADLVLTKESEKIVVQAKRYSKNVGISAIQEISASKSYYNATRAWVVSNSFFTKSAIELAQSNSVELLDRKALIDLVLKVNPNGVPTAREVRESVTPKEIHCPRCDSKMVLRNGRNGKFYGCSKFPRCKGTKAC